MDFGTLATQLGDFGKFFDGLVSFLQGVAKAVGTFSEWNTDAENGGTIVDNTAEIFGGSSSSADEK